MIYVIILLKNYLFVPMKMGNLHIFLITLNHKKLITIENVLNKDSMEFIKSIYIFKFFRVSALFASKFVKELNGDLETNSDEIKNFLHTPEYS